MGVLLFDEPTRGIDVGAKFEIYTLMGALAREGRALVVVSSDLRELMLICDRIGVMSAGRMTAVFERGNWTQDALLAAAFAGFGRETPPGGAQHPDAGRRPAPLPALRIQDDRNDPASRNPDRRSRAAGRDGAPCAHAVRHAARPVELSRKPPVRSPR